MERSKDIGHMRTSYNQGALAPEDVGNNPWKFFQLWFEEAQQDPHIKEANAMSICTLGTNGFPQSRIVLLKEFSPRGFIFYTNYESKKGKSIAQHAQVSLSFFWPSLERQVHIDGVASRLDENTSTRYFQSRPKGSQLGAWASNQSQVVQNRSVLTDRLKALEEQYKNKEVLPKPDFWGGYRVVAQRFEFWQGRPNRLHDRVELLPLENTWKAQRLSP